MNKKLPQLILLSLLISTVSGQIYSSEEEEVVQFIKEWAALESDLDAQANLIRDDRVMISGSDKWPNQVDNLMIQKERRSATLKRDPDWKIIQTIISPEAAPVPRVSEITTKCVIRTKFFLLFQLEIYFFKSLICLTLFFSNLAS